MFLGIYTSLKKKVGCHYRNLKIPLLLLQKYSIQNIITKIKPNSSTRHPTQVFSNKRERNREREHRVAVHGEVKEVARFQFASELRFTDTHTHTQHV